MSDTTATPVEPAATPEPPKAEEQAPTFSQADLDRIVEERLARERKKYADYDDVKAKADRLAEIEEANASEQDKALAAARKEVEEQMRSEFAAERVAAKIEVAAAGKFADVEDARLRLGSRVEEFMSGDGNVDAEAITKALDEVLEKHPHLAAKAPATAPSASRAGIGTGSKFSNDSVSPGYDRLRAAYSNPE